MLLSPYLYIINNARGGTPKCPKVSKLKYFRDFNIYKRLGQR